MTAVIGTNSYVNVIEATAYFADKYGYTLWAGESDKDGALVSACQQLDNMCDWYGSKVSDSQALAFPRTPDANPIPQVIKDAQCEIAYNIVSTGSVSTDGGDPLTELKAGSVQLKFDAKSTGNPLVNDLISRLLAPYGLCAGGGGTTLISIKRQ
jgi:hypothetical protein